MKHHQQQSQKQVQKQGYFLSQQHLKLMHLMHLSGYALQEYIANEVELNPALEVENENADETNEKEMDDVFDSELFTNDDDLFEKNYNQSSKDDYYEAPVIQYASLQENLKDQIHQMQLPIYITDIACYLIDELEDDGYLRRSLIDVTDDFSFSQGKVGDEDDFNEALAAVQKCEPSGIAARNLQECLLLQVDRKTVSSSNESALIGSAKSILENHFELFTQLATDKLKKKLNASDEELKSAIQFIQHLNPKPVTETNKYELMRQQIIPEFEISFDEEEMFVSLSQKDAVKLKVKTDLNTSVLRIHADGEKKQAENYYASLVDEAQSLVSALQERETTMMKVIYAIASMQTVFFKSGERKELKPMILQDIATATGFEISTISRITSNKYVQTQHGIFALKNLFMRNINPDVELNSQNTAVGIQDEIKNLVADENKSRPLSDNEITKLLTEKGISIARRTVVKYREAIGISNSTLRKHVLK